MLFIYVYIYNNFLQSSQIFIVMANEMLVIKNVGGRGCANFHPHWRFPLGQGGEIETCEFGRTQ